MKLNNTARENFLRDFNNKIDSLKDHKKYEWLRKYADDVIRWHTFPGFYSVKAEDFINRILQADKKIIEEWLDGKNKLEWELIKSQE